MEKVYMNENEGLSRRPLRRWKNRVKDYMCERGASSGIKASTRREGMFGMGEADTLLPCESHTSQAFPTSDVVYKSADRQRDRERDGPIN